MHKSFWNGEDFSMQKESTWWIWLLMAVVIVLDIAEALVAHLIINP